MKGILLVVRDGEIKMTLAGKNVVIKPDGTIWYLGVPLLGITDPDVKAKAAAAVKAKKFDQIPAEVFTRPGDNPNGLWVGDVETWNKHPAKLTADRKKAVRKAGELAIQGPPKLNFRLKDG
jgi:hypothetical protein